MMKLAFHNGKGEVGKEKFFTSLIKWWTRGKYCHVELVFSDGVSFSSSSQDGGVRYKVIDYAKHPERWDFVELPTYEGKEDFTRSIADKYIGKKYDRKAIFFYEFLPFRKEESDKWYCSEICMRVLCRKPKNINPNKMYKLAKNW